MSSIAFTETLVAGEPREEYGANIVSVSHAPSIPQDQINVKLASNFFANYLRQCEEQEKRADQLSPACPFFSP